MEKIRIMLADDHPVARAGIRKFLNKATDIEIIAEADNGIEALELAKRLVPDVLLLDIELPGVKGLEIAKELQASNSPVKILVLSTYDDKQFIFGLLGNGAAGYLTKEEVPETIVEAVRGVARGEKGWVSRRVAAIMSAGSSKEKRIKRLAWNWASAKRQWKNIWNPFLQNSRSRRAWRRPCSPYRRNGCNLL